jgi:hypothetical protein
VVNYGPPTDEEKNAGDQQKDINLQKEEDIKNAPTLSQAHVFVVDASQYDSTVEVRAFISNAIEDGGTCTVEFSKEGDSFSRSSTAFKDATTTQCGAITLSRSSFSSAGNWQVRVSYRSATLSGESNVTNMEIK